MQTRGKSYSAVYLTILHCFVLFPRGFALLWFSLIFNILQCAVIFNILHCTVIFTDFLYFSLCSDFQYFGLCSDFHRFPIFCTVLWCRYRHLWMIHWLSILPTPLTYFPHICDHISTYSTWQELILKIFWSHHDILWSLIWFYALYWYFQQVFFPWKPRKSDNLSNFWGEEEMGLKCQSNFFHSRSSVDQYFAKHLTFMELRLLNGWGAFHYFRRN